MTAPTTTLAEEAAAARAFVDRGVGRLADAITDIIEKPRNDPPVGSMVVRSGEVEDVARALVARFPDTFGHLDNWSVVFAEDAQPPKKGCKARARATIIPPVWQQLYGDDLAVLVSAKWWEQATGTERSACLFHTLSHVWTATEPESGEIVGLRMRDHDAETFHDEVAHFGPWNAAVRETARQMELFADSTAR